MPRIKIPDLALPGFEAIAQLNEEQSQKFSQFLNSLPVGSKMEDINNYLFSELNVTDSRSIVQTLVSFRELLEADNVDFEELSSSLVNSYKETKNEGREEEAYFLKRNLQLIFSNSKNLKLTLKAKQLSTEDSFIYSDSKIITDIRLVFNDEIEDEKRNAIVIHKLHLEYYQNKEIQDIFLTLDLSELKKLKDNIDRAIKKEDVIKKDYESIIHFINATD